MDALKLSRKRLHFNTINPPGDECELLYDDL